MEWAFFLLKNENFLQFSIDVEKSFCYGMLHSEACKGESQKQRLFIRVIFLLFPYKDDGLQQVFLEDFAQVILGMVCDVEMCGFLLN